MKKILLFLVCGILSSSAHLHAEEMVRFDFQQYVGEGTYDFYRVEVDLKNKTGLFCYFDQDSFVAAGGNLEKITEGTTWSQYISFPKVKTACAKFSLYNSSGWFMTDSSKFGEAEYRYFFIGNINKEKIDGKLYEFREHRSYKTTDYKLISANPSHK